MKARKTSQWDIFTDERHDRYDVVAGDISFGCEAASDQEAGRMLRATLRDLGVPESVVVPARHLRNPILRSRNVEL